MWALQPTRYFKDQGSEDQLNACMLRPCAVRFAARSMRERTNGSERPAIHRLFSAVAALIFWTSQSSAGPSRTSFWSAGTGEAIRTVSKLIGMQPCSSCRSLKIDIPWLPITRLRLRMPMLPIQIPVLRQNSASCRRMRGSSPAAKRASTFRPPPRSWRSHAMVTHKRLFCRRSATVFVRQFLCYFETGWFKTRIQHHP